MSDLYVVVMAGGAGTRFWPASTKKRPKQLLALTAERTMLQQAVDRVAGLVSPEHILVVTSADFADEVRAQLPELPRANILAEPLRKDTSAAIAWVSLVIAARSTDPARTVIAVLTSDQAIAPTAAFQADLTSAVTRARATGALYTFGIPPTFAATGYGYLQLAEDDERVLRYIEKPDRARAQSLVGEGCLWNSGMFVWTVRAILAELERALPAHLEALAPAVRGERLLTDAFAMLHKVSIDFGVMEKAKDVRCVRATFSWSDVGSFPALADHIDKDAHGNASRARVVTHDAHDNVVWSADAQELVALVGVRDLVVVRAGARTLVVHKDRAEDIKKLVESLPPSDQE